MTKVLVISDVHANLTALEAVLADAGKVNEVWCLGDIAGYGPDPNECIERIQALPKLTCMMGNHDYGCNRRHGTGDIQSRRQKSFALATRYIDGCKQEISAHAFPGTERSAGMSRWCTAARVTRSGNMS